ncbi:putative transcription factor B3-Domain family [Helianthus annuus]|nr:putative transcription factor B3-Domain family [Helianthus annuus]
MAPTNVHIETDDGRKFTVYISEAKGIFFLFHGWSDVITHLGIKAGTFVIFTPLDSTTFKLTYCVNGLSSICFWSSIVATPSQFTVIPDSVLSKSHDYTVADIISTMYLGNKEFHVKVQSCNVKSALQRVDIAPIDSLQDLPPTAVAEQATGHIIRFVRMAADYFRLPDDVSIKAKLDLGVKSITIRLLHLNPQKEFPNGTIHQARLEGYCYALSSWSRLMNIAGIKVGDTVYFCFDETEQVLSVERVVSPLNHI